MARERPTGATEEEIAALAETRKNISNLAKQENALREKLAPLLAKVRPLEDQLQQVRAARHNLQHQADRITWGIQNRVIEAARIAEQERLAGLEQQAREQKAARWREVVYRTQEAMQEDARRVRESSDPLAQAFSGVVGRVLGNPDFVWNLPRVEESHLDKAVTKTSNGERIRVRTEDDSCRLLLLADGTFGAIYNPKPNTPELETMDQIAASVKLPSGEVVNTRMFGITIDPETLVSLPFLVTRRKAYTGPRHTPSVLSAGIEESAPLMRKVFDILSAGDIDLPKIFGKATIPHPSRA